MLKSMTAFAARQGQGDGLSWAWEMRGVNGKGLDLRLRVPDWIEGLEAGLRAAISKACARGNVTLTLRLTREERGAGVQLNTAQLDTVLQAMAEVEARAMEAGVTLAPATAADLLGLRGVLETESGVEDSAALAKVLLADAAPLIADFAAMRAAEGRALQEVLEAQLSEIARLTEAAAEAAEARRPEIEKNFKTALQRVLTDRATDEARVAQELAVMAVKLDVTEEIDRLRAHVAAARTLIEEGSPVGRKLDFLAQEFNREANTLCSKAQNTGLTAIGLELKTVIDQMREQIQNVE
jgi:uncharacterized protein (TIGR00255 family)